jgi:hypothetical protein
LINYLEDYFEDNVKYVNISFSYIEAIDRYLYKHYPGWSPGEFIRYYQSLKLNDKARLLARLLPISPIECHIKVNILNYPFLLIHCSIFIIIWSLDIINSTYLGNIFLLGLLINIIVMMASSKKQTLYLFIRNKGKRVIRTIGKQPSKLIYLLSLNKSNVIRVVFYSFITLISLSILCVLSIIGISLSVLVETPHTWLLELSSDIIIYHFLDSLAIYCLIFTSTLLYLYIFRYLLIKETEVKLKSKARSLKVYE